jgi:hypothetical protein
MTATKPAQLRHRAPGGSVEVIVTDEGRKTDKLLDSHTRQVLPRLCFSLTLTEFVDRSQLGVWRPMGCDCNDGRIPYAHVLPVDLSVVL